MAYDDETDQRPTIADPRTGEVLPMPVEAPDLQRQQLQIGSADMGFIMTAQRIASPRKTEGQIRNALATLCAQNGDQYIYSWEVYDRQNKRKVVVEGLTIKGAMDLARTYGNCFAGVVGLKDMGQRWLVQAAFIDLETGFNVRRDFLQRKGQDTGMRDAERQADIVFQIGQSKAIRNAVVQANPSTAEFMVEESKKRLVSWITENTEKANSFIDRGLVEFGIAETRIEAVIGRPRKEWTVRDIARVIKELRGVHDGLVNASDLYPTDTDAAKVIAEKEAKKAKDAKAETKDTPKPKDDAPAAEDAGKKVVENRPVVSNKDPRLAVKIADIESLGTRTKNSLAKVKWTHIGHIIEKKPEDLLALDGFGDKCLTELNAYLASVKLTLNSVMVAAADDPNPAKAETKPVEAETKPTVQESPPAEKEPEPEQPAPAEDKQPAVTTGGPGSEFDFD